MINRFFLAFIALTVPSGLALPQAVFVAPHAVFIDSETGTAEITVGNDSDARQEVTIDIAFGFPDSDERGTPFIRFIENPGPEFPSAADWISAFPRRVQLEPGARQTVRLLARPPANLPDGEHWARVILTARGSSVTLATGDTGVQAGLRLEFRILVGVTYQQGDLETGIRLASLAASMDADSLSVWVEADPAGNAAYRGTARFAVLDAAGQTVRDWAIPHAVYYPITRRFVFRSVGLPAGDYRLAVSLEAVRDDLEPHNVLPAPPVADTVAFTVP